MSGVKEQKEKWGYGSKGRHGILTEGPPGTHCSPKEIQLRSEQGASI